MMFFRSRTKEIRSIADGDGNPSWLALQGFSGTYGGRAAEQITTVTACINIIAHTLSILKPTIKDSAGNDITASHTLGMILKSPDRDLSFNSWLQLMATEYLISGNAIAIMRQVGERLVLTHVPWSYVYDYDGDTYKVTFPTARGRSQGAELFMMSEVLHWRAISGSRDGGFIGRSVLQRCANAINLAGILDTAVSQYFSNGCAPSGIFSVKQKLNPDQIKQMTSAFADNYTGATKAGKPLMLHGDATFQTVGNDARNAQLVEQRRYQVSEIARVFGVPLAFLASDLNTTTYASAYEQRMALLMSLQGYIASFTSAFNVKFLQPDEYLELDESMLLQDLQPATTPQSNMQGVQ